MNYSVKSPYDAETKQIVITVTGPHVPEGGRDIAVSSTNPPLASMDELEARCQQVADEVNSNYTTAAGQI